MFKFFFFIIDDDPKTICEEAKLQNGKVWKKAMVKEMVSLDYKKAWDLVDF